MFYYVIHSLVFHTRPFHDSEMKVLLVVDSMKEPVLLDSQAQKEFHIVGYPRDSVQSLPGTVSLLKAVFGHVVTSRTDIVKHRTVRKEDDFGKECF
jgi:hypothetical protein